ncbi:hypothetical protein DITRI_Ditri18aG0106800 [Diplodiscus trichospermus]
MLQVGIGLLILQQLSGIDGVLFYSINIFERAGFSSSNVATFGLGVIQVVATGVTTWASSLKILTYIADSIMAILSLVGLVALVISFSLGVGAIPWVIMSEILLVNIKGLAGSVATLSNWLVSWATAMTAN